MLDFLRFKQPFRPFSTTTVSNIELGNRPPITALLIDISGTLHVGATPTHNAVNAFRRLRESSIPFRLCSNNSKESTVSLMKRLEAMGFEGLEMHRDSSGENGGHSARQQRLVWTSIGAMAQVIKDMGLKEPFLLLSDSAREEVVGKPSNDNYSQEDNRFGNHQHDSVVIGLAPSSLDYAHLNTAFRILKGEIKYAPEAGGYPKGVPLITAHQAKYVQTEDGLSLGPGPFVTALENASGVTALVVGKPTKAFFQMVIDDFENQAHEESGGKGSTRNSGRIAVIGDDVEADLGSGALELGLWRILVKTGKYRAGDEKRTGVVPPDEIFDSFADLVQSLLRRRE